MIYDFSKLSDPQREKIVSLFNDGDFLEIKNLVIGRYNVMAGCSSCAYVQTDCIICIRKQLIDE